MITTTKKLTEKQKEILLKQAFADVNKIYIKYGEKLKIIEDHPFYAVSGTIELMRFVFEELDKEGLNTLTEFVQEYKTMINTDGMTPQ